MKILNKENLFIILMTIIGCYLKTLYVEITDKKIILYKFSVLLTNNNVIVDFILITPIILIILLESKDIYISLTKFNNRYHNRLKYYKSVIRKTLYSHFVICMIVFIINNIFIHFVLNYGFSFSLNNIQVICKFMIELYFIIILITTLAFIVNSYIYSFITIVSILLIFLTIDKNWWIPFISLFVNFRINIFTLLITLVLWLILKIIYIRKDLGGIKNENRN